MGPRGSTTRRGLLAGLLGMSAAVSLAACAPPTPVVAPARQDVRLRSVWTGRPDGPVPPNGDEGVALRAVRLDGSPAPASITGGALVGNLPDEKSAVYVLQALDRPVRTLGARFAFTPGGPTGCLCLATWTGGPASDTNCHLVITPARWVYGVAQGNELHTIGDGPLVLPQDGTPITAWVDLDGGPTASLHLPGGQDTTVTDARIATIRGRVANWEFYKNAPGDAAVRIYEIWAG